MKQIQAPTAIDDCHLVPHLLYGSADTDDVPLGEAHNAVAGLHSSQRPQGLVLYSQIGEPLVLHYLQQQCIPNNYFSKFKIFKGVGINFTINAFVLANSYCHCFLVLPI